MIAKNTLVIILFLLIILTGYYIYVYCVSTYNIQPFNDVWFGKKNIAKQLVFDTDNIMISLNILMIPMYESLLGLIRHTDFIPWNENISMCVISSDFQKILNNKELFENKSIVVKSIAMFDTKIIKIYSLDAPEKELKYPCINIYKYHQKDGDIILESPSTKYTFAESVFFPLRTNLLSGIPLSIPNNPDIILNKIYTDKWEQMCTSIQPSGLISKLFNKSYKIKCSSISDVKDDVFKNTWVINLKRRSDRWDLSNSRLNSIGIYPKRFNAVDAKNKNIINLYNTIDHPKRTINEVACYLSHKKLWRRIYELNLPYALIFEDDVFIGDKINKTSIMDAVKNSIGFNIIFLGHCHGNILNFSFPETKVGSALCLNAYIVSRTGVEKLLQQDDDFSKPIDHFTRDLCKDNLCFLSKTTHTPGMYGQGIIKQDDVNLKSNLRDRSKLIETVL